MRSVTVCDQDDLGTCGGECYRCRLESLQKRLDELVQAVGEMRHAQIDYWRRNRNHAAFLVAKRAEKEVDEMLEHIRTPRLF